MVCHWSLGWTEAVQQSLRAAGNFFQSSALEVMDMDVELNVGSWLRSGGGWDGGWLPAMHLAVDLLLTAGDPEPDPGP